MGRSPCCPKEGLNRGAWTAHEDKVLKDYIRLHGEGRWRNLPNRAGLKRCGKSCRLRWLNYLRPDIKRGNISSDEEELIIRLHKLLGNRWSLIAGRLPGRTDNEIKNYWNTNLGKKVKDHHHSNNQTTSSSPAPLPQIGNTTHQNHNPNPKLLTDLSTTTPSPKPDNNNNNNNSQHVVRTKATKCSKLLLISPPLPSSSSSMRLQKHHSHSDAVTRAKVVVDAKGNNDPSSINYRKESNNNNVYDNDGVLSSSLLGDDEKELSTEDLLMMDYDVVGDVCLSDLLNSDFCANNNGSNDDVDLLSPSSEQHPPVMFSDEIFKDWTQSNFAEMNE